MSLQDIWDFTVDDPGHGVSNEDNLQFRTTYRSSSTIKLARAGTLAPTSRLCWRINDRHIRESLE